MPRLTTQPKMLLLLPLVLGYPLDPNNTMVMTDIGLPWAKYDGQFECNAIIKSTTFNVKVINTSRPSSTAAVWQAAYSYLLDPTVAYVEFYATGNQVRVRTCTSIQASTQSYDVFGHCAATYSPTAAPTPPPSFGPLTETECDALGGTGTWQTYAFDDNQQTYVRYCETDACSYTFDNGDVGVLANACPPLPAEAHVRGNGDVCVYCRNDAGIEMMYCGSTTGCNSTHYCKFTDAVYYDACVGEGMFMYPDYGPMNESECVARGGGAEYWSNVTVGGLVPTRYCNIAVCDEVYINGVGDVTNACPATPSEGRVRNNAVPCEYCIVDGVITMMYCNETCAGEYKCPNSHLWQAACTLEYSDTIVDYGPLTEAECYSDGGSLWAEYNFTDTGVRYARFCDVAECWQSFNTTECDTIRSHLPVGATPTTIQASYQHCTVTGVEPLHQNYTSTADADSTTCALACVADSTCTGFLFLSDTCYLNMVVPSLPLVSTNSSCVTGIQAPYVDRWWVGCGAQNVTYGTPNETQNVPGYCMGTFLFPTVWNETTPDLAGAYSVELSYSTSISSNGFRLVVGSPSSTGTVRVYNYTDNVWLQEGTDITGSTGDYLGVSVALASQTPTYMAVGATQSTGSPGYVRYYQYTGGSWIQVGSDLTGDAVDDMFGYAVALSGDGSILIASGPNSATPYIKVFSCTSSACTETDTVVGTGAYGYSVSVSLDGSTFVVGDPNPGVYDIDDGMLFLGQDIYTIGGLTESWGLGVAINPNGTLIAYTNGNCTVLIRDPLVGITGSIPSLDTDCVLAPVTWSVDGMLIIVGNFVFGGAATYVYRSGSWVQHTIFVSGASTGASVSASYDGQEIAIASRMTVNYTAVFIRNFANIINTFASTEAQCVLACNLDTTCTHFYYQSPLCQLFRGSAAVEDSLSVVSGIKNTRNTLNACPFLSTESRARNNSAPCTYCMGNATSDPIEMAYCPGTCGGNHYCQYTPNLINDACLAEYAPTQSPTSAPTSTPTPQFTVNCFVINNNSCYEQSDWCMYDDFYKAAQYTIHPLAFSEVQASSSTVALLDAGNLTLLQNTVTQWLGNATASVNAGACWCPSRSTEWFPYGPVASATVSQYAAIPNTSYPREFYMNTYYGFGTSAGFSYYTDLNTRGDAVVVIENNTLVFSSNTTTPTCACEYVETSIDVPSCAFVCVTPYYAAYDGPFSLVRYNATNETSCPTNFLWINQLALLRTSHSDYWQKAAALYTSTHPMDYVWTPWLNASTAGNCPLFAENYCSPTLVAHSTYASFYCPEQVLEYFVMDYIGVSSHTDCDAEDALYKLVPEFIIAGDASSARYAIYNLFWTIAAQTPQAECFGLKTVSLAVNSTYSVNVTTGVAWMGRRNTSGCIGLYGCWELSGSVCELYAGCTYVSPTTITTTTTTGTFVLNTLPPPRTYNNNPTFHLASTNDVYYYTALSGSIGLLMVSLVVYRHIKQWRSRRRY